MTTTKLYCLRKDNMYVDWDGKSMTERPQNGTRVSRTIAKRKYPGCEMIAFPEAYIQWFNSWKENKEATGSGNSVRDNCSGMPCERKCDNCTIEKIAHDTDGGTE